MRLSLRVTVTFTDRDGDEHSVKAKVGNTLLEVAKENDIDLEGESIAHSEDTDLSTHSIFPS